jgi:hypothetical protein
MDTAVEMSIKVQIYQPTRVEVNETESGRTYFKP